MHHIFHFYSAFIAAALFTIVLAAPIADATPFNYQESVSGDLPSDGTPLPTFTADVGSNTVQGQEALGGPDFDSFSIVVPAHLSMNGGSLDVTGDLSVVAWAVYAGPSGWKNGNDLFDLVVGNGQQPIGSGSAAIPQLGPGTYNFSADGIGGTAMSLANYTFTFNVVPEPASLSLLGIAVVAIFRRSRSRSLPE